ncbi:MAG: TIGR03936 family radical SAM-associated protein [Dehalococcoidales bacterium]|nr:TIGR03936 family radical SAM-associated protein [Dehalococcoidales bacterium]
MQRLRIRFSRREEIKFISHLDIMRLWQRALHRAGIPLAYTEGFSPHPRISLAAPLAVGVTSQAELMDTFCTKWVSPHFFTDAVSQQLPPGIEILQVYSVAPTMPSLQSQVGYAEYEVELETEKDKPSIESALASLLSVKKLPWHHERDTGTRSYDLRALIDDLWLIDWRSGYCTVGMRLRCDSGGSGRPEQVAAALGFSHPTSIRRTKLILKTG